MMSWNSRNIYLRITDRGVVSVNRAVDADAVDITVTERPGAPVTRRLWSRSPWWPEFVALLGIEKP